MEKPSEGKSFESRGKYIAFDKLNVKIDPDDEMLCSFEGEVIPPPSITEVNKEMRCIFACCRDSDHAHSIIENNEMTELFLNHPPLQVMENPIIMVNIQRERLHDQDHELKYSRTLSYQIHWRVSNHLSPLKSTTTKTLEDLHP